MTKKILNFLVVAFFYFLKEVREKCWKENVILSAYIWMIPGHVKPLEWIASAIYVSAGSAARTAQKQKNVTV